MATEPLILVLDLGDVFAKGLAIGAGRRQRLRFPSAIAHRFLDKVPSQSELLLDSQVQFIRPTEFEPSAYPRTRSYPGSETLLAEVRTGGHPVTRVRMAGWLAAAYGADRQILGTHPTAENIDALVRKALQLCAVDCETAEVVFIVDVGTKSEALAEYAERPDWVVDLSVWSYVRSRMQHSSVRLHGRVLDAGACAMAAAPSEASIGNAGRTLLIDIGYLRSKLTILSEDGCEHLEQFHDLGIADCVRRVLRDEHENALIEDEFAIVRALERAPAVIEVAGRKYDVTASVARAGGVLEQELGQAVERAAVEHFARRGETCRAAAIIGGGAAIVGAGLAARLEGGALRLGSVWVSPDSSFFLLRGAERLCRASSWWPPALSLAC